MKIIPIDKFDQTVCDNLLKASNETILENIDELLEWTQDGNWPVADPITTRLSKLGTEIVVPLLKIFNSSDGEWKWFTINNLLPKLDDQVIEMLKPKLNEILVNPTKNDLYSGIDVEIKEFFESR